MDRAAPVNVRDIIERATDGAEYVADGTLDLIAQLYNKVGLTTPIYRGAATGVAAYMILSYLRPACMYDVETGEKYPWALLESEDPDAVIVSPELISIVAAIIGMGI